MQVKNNAQAQNVLQENTPWYRIGMVWLMIGLPAIVVVASLTTAVVAYKNAPQIIVQHQSN